MKTFSAKRTAVYIFCLTILSKCLGFIREVVMANAYGTSFVTDAYVLAQSIPGMLFGGILGAIGTAYTPVYSRIVENKGDGNKFTSQLITIIECFAVLSSLVGLFFAEPITRLIAKNFSPEAFDLCVFYTKVAFSFVMFNSTRGILSGYLQYKNIFTPQSIGDYLQNLCIISVIIISSKTNNMFLIFGLFFGYAANCLFSYFIAHKEQYSFRPSFSFDNNIKEVCSVALPVFLSSELGTINSFIDRFLAARLVTGSIASLSYGLTISTLALSLTASIISTVMYPKITKDAATENWEHFSETCKLCITMDLLIIIPCALGFIAFSNEIIQVIYERGAFSGISTDMTSVAFKMYSLMLPFSALNTVFAQMCYSLKDSKPPFFCGLIGVPINIILNLILVRKLNHAGLALATSITTTISMTLLFIMLKTKHKEVKINFNKKELLLIIIASALSVFAAKYIYPLLHTFILRRTIVLGLSCCFAAMIYYLLIRIFRIRILDKIIPNWG